MFETRRFSVIFVSIVMFSALTMASSNAQNSSVKTNSTIQKSTIQKKEVRQEKDELKETKVDLAKSKVEQEKKKGIKKDVRKKFYEIKKLAANGEWDKLKKAMAKKASDEFCSLQVMSAICIQKYKDSIPFKVESLEVATDAVADIFAEYDIDPQELDNIKIRKIGGDNPITDKEIEGAKKKAVETEKKILKALDKSGKRWEIVGKLFKIQTISCFSLNPMNGQIVSVAVPKDNLAFATITSVGNVKPDIGGIQLNFNTPPMIVRFEKIDKKGWVYQGIDSKETAKAVEDYIKKQKKLHERKKEEIF